MNIERLAKDMEALYDMLYKHDGWVSYFGSRERTHVHYRHMVRYLVQQNRRATYDQIARAEALLSGHPAADHTTIMNSIKVFNEHLRHDYRGLIQNLNLFYDAWLVNDHQVEESSYINRIIEFSYEPEYVKNIVLACLLEYNMIHPGILRTLFNEYRQVDHVFLDHLIRKEQHAKAEEIAK